MSLFAITFRIHEDSTYQERYDSLVKEIKSEATDKIWDETTSFFLIKNDKSSKTLCNDLYLHSSILESKDILLVINLSQKGYDQRGAKLPVRLSNLMDKR
jgi:hypothetical protein